MNDFRRLRLALGLTQRGFADAVGYSTHRAIAHWERGDTMPRSWALRRLYELFGDKIKELGLDLPENPEEKKPTYEMRRFTHTDCCGRCGREIVWHHWRRVLVGAPNGEGAAEKAPRRRAFEMCSACTADEFYRQAVRRYAHGRYDALRRAGLI